MTKFDNVVHSILNETPDPNLDHWMKEVMNALRGEGFTKVAYNDRGNIEAVGPAEIYQPSMSGSTANVEVYQHGGKLHAYGDPEQHPSLTNTQRNQGMVGGPPMSGMIS